MGMTGKWEKSSVTYTFLSLRVQRSHFSAFSGAVLRGMGYGSRLSNPGFSINQQWGLWQTGKHYLILNLYIGSWTSEMSYWVKVLTFKSDNLSKITRTHMVVRLSPESRLTSTHVHPWAHTHVHTKKISKLIRYNFRKFLIVIITVALSKGCDN